AAILAYKKEAGQTSRRQHGGNADNQKGRVKGQVVHGAYVLSIGVNAVAATDHCSVISKEVVSEADARLRDGGVIVAQERAVKVPSETGNVKPADAGAIHKRLPGGRRGRIHIRDLAELVIGRADELQSKAEVQRQARGRFIVVLGKEGITGEAVVVVGRATTAQCHHRGAQQEVLKVRHW